MREAVQVILEPDPISGILYCELHIVELPPFHAYIYVFSPAAVTISQKELFDASLAAVALSIRRMLEDQLTESSVANTIAFLESVDDVPFSNDCKLGGTWLSSWTKYPIAGEERDL